MLALPQIEFQLLVLLAKFVLIPRYRVHIAEESVTASTTPSSMGVYLQKQNAELLLAPTLWQVEATRAVWSGAHIMCGDLFRLKRYSLGIDSHVHVERSCSAMPALQHDLRAVLVCDIAGVSAVISTHPV